MPLLTSWYFNFRISCLFSWCAGVALGFQCACLAGQAGAKLQYLFTWGTRAKQVAVSEHSLLALC